MVDTVGIALEATVVRAVFAVRGRTNVLEIPWSAEAPEEAVEQLRLQVGPARALSLAVGLGFLETARPELPPLSGDDRRRVLLRDADRYFPLDSSAAVAPPGAGGVAFAVSADQLRSWVAAFEGWAPVRAVVAAPDAIARVLAERDGAATTFTVDAAPGEQGLLSVEAGHVREARRLTGASAAAALNDTAPIGDSVLDTVPGRYAAALGAMDSIQLPLERMLLDVELAQTLSRARERRRWMSYGLFAATLVALVAATSVSRDHTLRATQHAVDSLAALAQPAMAAEARLAAMEQEARVIRARGQQRQDALAILATVSRALPPDVFVERFQWDGTEWRLDGSANQAASVVPALDAAARLTTVHSLGASTRFRDGNRMRESFAVAFRVTGDTNAAH